MASVTELELSGGVAPSLLGADGGALERLAAACSVRTGVLVADGVCRVRLSGTPSACAAAEAALWRAGGDALADERGWFVLDASSTVHGPCSSASLNVWWQNGHLRADLPVRNGASTAWLSLGALLRGSSEHAARDDAMDVDGAAAADALASWRSSGADAAPDASMLDAAPPADASAPVVHLVFDTCVLLTRLPALRTAAATLRGAAVALIPWTAVCELDGLKKSVAPGVAKMARDAIAALAAALGGAGAPADPFFRGESAAEWRAAALDADSTAPGGRATGDDRILATALRLRDRGGRVLLVTNDANLRLKALVNGLAALPDHALPATPAALAEAASAAPPAPPPTLLLRAPSVEAPQPQLQLGDLEPRSAAPMAPAAAPMVATPAMMLPREPQLELNLDVLPGDHGTARATPPPSAGATAKAPAAPPMAPPSSPRMPPAQQQTLFAMDADAALAAALACVARGASPVLEALLTEELDAMWRETVAEAPPFSGRDALRVLRQHWNSCFRARVPHRAYTAAAAVEDACRAVGRRGGVGAHERDAAARDAAHAAAELLAALPAPADSAAALAAACADAAALLASLQR